MSTITIKNRAFKVKATGNARMPYMLTGSRGAIYAATRYTETPNVMCLLNAHGQHALGRDVELVEIDGGAVRRMVELPHVGYGQ